MPPHPEVPAALQRLNDHDFRLFTLTNNPPETSGRQLERAGLSDLFERRFSVETVRCHKPAPKVYHWVADALEVDPGAICLVACHVWDTIAPRRPAGRLRLSSARATRHSTSARNPTTSGRTSMRSRTN